MDENTTTADQLNLLRSILRSDDHLQVQPSGDYEQVRMKLDHDVQISFFFDSIRLLTQTLTINNIHDLRISKASNKCPLTNEQWNNIRQYFDELVQKSNKDTSIYSIIQIIQDHLLQTKTTNPKYKPKEKKASTTEDVSTLNNKFRGGDLIFNRILHDKSIDRSRVIIGYEDRFSGIHEIAFNEFKKVHDHEYGVPMHRIRYYKINGNIVWDRTNKIDILTGSEQQNELADDVVQGAHYVEGLYHFVHSLQQWIQYPHISLSADDPKTPSSNEECLPEQCHFVTWNILYDYHHPSLIHTAQRYPAILDTLKSLLPDVICLQEVTASFFDLLLREVWLQEHNYYMIIMQSVISSEKDKSYGQLILTKNFRPRSFTICPLDFSDNATASTTTTVKKATKELIIARFGLTARITIDLVNLHLHSDLSRNAEDKRCRALENLFRQMNTNNYMLMGDFNFGDHHEKEQKLLEKYADVHDLWKDTYDLNENPGLTFDPENNICARITSISQIQRRLDRYFLHNLQNLSYSIEHLSMVGTDPIAIDRQNNDDDKRISLSDHYGLQLIMQFRTRSTSHRSALVVLPTTNQWPLIESYREQYDPSFNRWPPHFNLLWPFFDLNENQGDEESILLPLRLLLSQYQSFDAEINSIETFVENNICFMKLNEPSTKRVKELYEQLKQLFPQCCTNNRNSYNPHMTIAQFENEEKRIQAQSSLTLSKPFQFPVQYLYILQRPHDNDTTPFRITYQLPLGPVLPSLGSVDSKLQELFQSLNLYENEQSYKRKQDKFEKLSSCFKEMFNEKTLHRFTHSFLPYGSFRIGVNGADVDTVFVLNEVKSNENEPTEFDRTLQQLKNDNQIADLLETQINGNLKDEIVSYRKIQALFPIISILFKDQTKVEIFVQIKTEKEPIHGVHEIEYLLIHSRSPPIFQYLLSFVRSWAQRVGLYGQVYGYLSGYSWAILCAHICHASPSLMSSLSSIENFSIDDFFQLVYRFFFTYAQFPWSTQSIHLHAASSKQIIHSQKSSVHNRGAMRIISPISPFNNTGRSTFDSTRDLIVQGFQRVVELLDQINTSTTEDKTNALKQILELNNDFPNAKIKSFLQLTFSCGNENELDEYIGWMKSRLAYFLNDCEEKCHFTFQTQNTIEQKSETTEALYSIGFQPDEETLTRHQTFNNRLNKFIDQLNLYPNRTDTMNVSHKLISIHDWKLERMEPKPQRIRK